MIASEVKATLPASIEGAKREAVLLKLTALGEVMVKSWSDWDVVWELACCALVVVKTTFCPPTEGTDRDDTLL